MEVLFYFEKDLLIIKVLREKTAKIKGFPCSNSHVYMSPPHRDIINFRNLFKAMFPLSKTNLQLYSFPL